MCDICKHEKRKKEKKEAYKALGMLVLNQKDIIMDYETYSKSDLKIKNVLYAENSHVGIYIASAYMEGIKE